MNKGLEGTLSALLVMLLLLAATMLITSCSPKLSSSQLNQRNEINYELDKAWAEYQYKADSLIIELDKIQ